MNISALLASTAEPDRLALILPDDRNSRISFRALDDLSSRLAEGFFRSGVRDGDRILVMSPLSIRLYAGLIALFKLGAAAVFLEPQTSFSQLDRAAAFVDADALFCSGRVSWLRYLTPSLRRIRRVFLTNSLGQGPIAKLPERSAPRRPLYEAAEDTPALITFTGGSTDPAGSRGVIRTHGLLSAQHLALSDALPIRTCDVDMTAFPIVTLHNLASGVTTVIPNLPLRRPDVVRPENVISQIAAWRVTTASGPPAFWAAVVRHCLRHELVLPLRRIATGGAVASGRLVRELQRVAPSAEIISVYGSTEAEPVAVIQAAEYLDRRASQEPNGIPLGRPVPAVQVRILDDAGMDQPAGQIGPIWVSGRHVARRYFAAPGAEAHNKRHDTDGRLWHRMGDLGYLDSEGMLWLSGRENAVVLRDGRPLYPAPIEEFAVSLPYIQRAAFFGASDASLGQRSVLAVELTGGVAAPAGWQEQLKISCIVRGWAVDEVRSMRRLPVDARHHSRIDYRRLRPEEARP